MTDDTGCDGEPVDALGFDVIEVDNSSVEPGDDPAAPEFNGGVTHFTFDLLVVVTDQNDWTATRAEAVLTGSLAFFDHPWNNETPPMASLVSKYPASEFDSFYLTTEGDPNNLPPFKDPGFAEQDGLLWFRNAVWFDPPPNGGVGVLPLARYTLIVRQGSPVVPTFVPVGEGGGAPILGSLTGDAMSMDTWGDCNGFAFDIIVGQCRGDLDNDYDIDQADLGILLADWGCTSDCVGDIDGDDDTDQADLGILLAYWGEGCP